MNFKNSNGEYENAKTLVIPEGVEEISSYAFSGMNIESVIIPDSVKKIGSYAFANCSNLKSIILGKNVTSVESYAFYSVFNVEAVWYMSGGVDYHNIQFEAPNSQQIISSPTYYYSKDEPSLTEKISGLYWHFDENNEPSLWSEGINQTNTVDGKTYKHVSTEVVVSDEYWSMLQEAKAQGMLEYVLEADVLVLFNSSSDKEDYQAKLNTYYSNLFSTYTITFEKIITEET